MCLSYHARPWYLSTCVNSSKVCEPFEVRVQCPSGERNTSHYIYKTRSCQTSKFEVLNILRVRLSASGETPPSDSFFLKSGLFWHVFTTTFWQTFCTTNRDLDSAKSTFTYFFPSSLIKPLRLAGTCSDQIANFEHRSFSNDAQAKSTSVPAFADLPPCT